MRLLGAICGLLACGVASSNSHREHDCTHPCKAGYCKFEDCTEKAECPGGLCEFWRCQNPDCAGGACTFHECSHPTCPGGGCKFYKPVTTLVDGYCDGGACEYNGKPWAAKMKGELSL